MVTFLDNSKIKTRRSILMQRMKQNYLILVFIWLFHNCNNLLSVVLWSKYVPLGLHKVSLFTNRLGAGVSCSKPG